MSKPQPAENCVIAHDTDYDGFGAAWAAYEWFGEEATYVAHGDHSEPPEVEEGTDLFLLDYSYDPEKMEWLLDRHLQVVVIDHHKTNAEAFLKSDLAERRLGPRLEDDWFISTKYPITYYYSSNDSAATLAWDFFFGGLNPHGRYSAPPLLQHIEDYDLWNFDMEGTEEIAVALDQIGLSIETIGEYAHYPGTLVEIGEPMIKYRDSLLRRFADRADIRTEDLPGIGETTFAIVNATICRSKLSERILEEEDEVEMVAMYRVISTGKVVVSLRSQGTVDVSEMATELGGGGHAGSSGFPTTLDKLPSVFK